MKIEKSQASKPSRAIRLPCVCNLTGMSKATIWRRVHDDPKFPKPFKLSAGITVWDENAVLAWLAIKQRAPAVAKLSCSISPSRSAEAAA